MAVDFAFACPGCGEGVLVEDVLAAEAFRCPCGWSGPRHPGSIRDGRPVRCPACGDPRLYAVKDFNRKVGIGLLVAGFALAILLGAVAGPWGFFGALVGSLLLDTLLYLVAGTAVVCHWCEATLHDGPAGCPEFDLALHDLVRWQKEVAAKGQAVPEHEGLAPVPGAEPVHPTGYDGPARRP